MPKSPDDDLKLPGLLKVHQVNFRKATGLTQAELARAVGLNGNTLSQIMNGELPLTAEKKKLLTKELLLEEDDSDEFDEAWEHDERIKWAKGHGERAVPHVRPSMAEEES